MARPLANGGLTVSDYSGANIGYQISVANEIVCRWMGRHSIVANLEATVSVSHNVLV